MFYSENLPKGKWTQIFLNSANDGSIIAIYTTGNAEGFYFYSIKSASTDDPKVKSVVSIKIDGKIDFAKVAAIAAKISLP